MADVITPDVTTSDTTTELLPGETPMKSTGWDTQAGIYALIGAVGILSNLLVVIVIVLTSRLRQKILNQFILNQSIIDIYTSVLLIAHAATDIEPTGLSSWSGDLYCKLWANKLFMWTAMLTSTFNLLAVTIERYLEVVHPIWHRASFTNRRAYMLMMSSWVLAPAFLFSCGIPTSIVINGNCMVTSHWASEGARRFVGVLTFALEYFIPLAVMCYCYTGMAIALNIKVDPDETRSEAEKMRQLRMKRGRKNVIKTLGICVFLFAFCWGPNQFLFLVYNLGYPPNYSSIFYHVTVYSAYVNLVVNPLVYSFKYQQFQTATLELFCMKKLRTSSASTASSIPRLATSQTMMDN